MCFFALVVAVYKSHCRSHVITLRAKDFPKIFQTVPRLAALRTFPNTLYFYHESNSPQGRGIHSHKQCHRELSDQTRTFTIKDAFYAFQAQQSTRAQHPPPTQIQAQQPAIVQHPPPTQVQPHQPTRMQHFPPTQIKPQQPTRVHPPPTQIQTVASYHRPSLPSGSEMPDEWGFPLPSAQQVPSAPFFSKCMADISSQPLAPTDIPRNVQGAAVSHPSGSVPRGAPQSHPLAPPAPPVPICRYPNCLRPVDRDERTRELTEFCSLDHMRFVVSFADPCSMCLT